LDAQINEPVGVTVPLVGVPLVVVVVVVMVVFVLVFVLMRHGLRCTKSKAQVAVSSLVGVSVNVRAVPVDLMIGG
jgi:uncharacterized membrane protein YGL010W